jgi:hypothetical protein
VARRTEQECRLRRPSPLCAVRLRMSTPRPICPTRQCGQDRRTAPSRSRAQLPWPWTGHPAVPHRYLRPRTELPVDGVSGTRQVRRTQRISTTESEHRRDFDRLLVGGQTPITASPAASRPGRPSRVEALPRSRSFGCHGPPLRMVSTIVEAVTVSETGAPVNCATQTAVVRTPAVASTASWVIRCGASVRISTPGSRRPRAGSAVAAPMMQGPEASVIGQCRRSDGRRGGLLAGDVTRPG